MESIKSSSNIRNVVGTLDLKHKICWSNWQIASGGKTLIALSANGDAVCFISLKTGKPFSKFTCNDQKISSFVYLETQKQLICVSVRYLSGSDTLMQRRSGGRTESKMIGSHSEVSKLIQIADDFVAVEDFDGLSVVNVNTFSEQYVLKGSKCQFTTAKINHFFVTMYRYNSKILICDAKNMAVSVVLDAKMLDFYSFTNVSALHGNHLLVYGYNTKGVNLRTLEFKQQEKTIDVIQGKNYELEKSCSSPFLLTLGQNKGIVKFSMSDPVYRIEIEDNNCLQKEILFNCYFKVDLLYLNENHKIGIGIQNLSGNKLTQKIITLKLS